MTIPFKRTVWEVILYLPYQDKVESFHIPDGSHTQIREVAARTRRGAIRAARSKAYELGGVMPKLREPGWIVEDVRRLSKPIYEGI